MLAVRVMQMAANQIVHMVTVRHRFVATPWSMDVRGFVLAAIVVGRALSGVFFADRNGVVIDMSIVYVMEVPVV
jgi:hypothetical protein